MEIESEPHLIETESPAGPPSLANFNDYREYLRSYFAYRRAQSLGRRRPYSYGDFSAAADIRSPNYLKLIISGHRNLSPETAARFAKALQLNRSDTDEFLALVRYNQASEPLERNRHLKTLAELRWEKRQRTTRLAPKAEQKKLSWVTFAVHALVDQKGVQFSPSEIHRLLMGRASRDDIERSIADLISCGELEQNPLTGKMQRGLKPAAATRELPAPVVRQVQAELTYLGMESLLQDDQTEREIGTVTLCLTESEFEALKFELRHLRKRIYKDTLVGREQGPGDRVFQLNIQLFPLSQAAAPAIQSVTEPPPEED